MMKKQLMNIFVCSTIMSGYLLVSCSPTRFSKTDTNLSVCLDSDTTCTVNQDGSKKINTTFTVGVGKVDVVFVMDNTASMSPIIQKISDKFSQFISILDNKKFDYKIGMMSVDANSASLVTFSNGSTAVTSSDSNKTTMLFNNDLTNKAIGCENLIRSYYQKYGSDFQSNENYARAYANVCSSSDERGLYNTYNFLNTDSSFLRSNANLVFILVSNEDERSGMYNTNSNYALASTETPAAITGIMNSKYPSKYWEFNSIVVTNSTCANTQKNSLTDTSGNVIRNSQGNSVIDSEIGTQYLNLSNQTHKGIDGDAVNVGRVVDICSSDYSTYFQNISANILESGRVFPLGCTPVAAPVVTPSNVPYTYDQVNQRLVFTAGSEGSSVTIAYTCPGTVVK